MKTDEDDNITYGSVNLYTDNACCIPKLSTAVPSLTSLFVHVLLHKQLTVDVIFKGKRPPPNAPNYMTNKYNEVLRTTSPDLINTAKWWCFSFISS